MIRLALTKLSELEATSVEDTAETLKLIVEWRGRVSILTDDDRAFASDLLKLDTDNASGLRCVAPCERRLQKCINITSLLYR